MARYGYARISTRSQRDDSQLDALRAVGCERIWTDTASGKLARRPEWDNCLDHLRRGDELAVTRLSRMARSVRHLTETAALLAGRGIDLVVLKQGIDTTTPAGRFTFHVLAAMDEMLADLISEGTREGLESARARGRVGGRKPKLTTRQAEVARGMYDETGGGITSSFTISGISANYSGVPFTDPVIVLADVNNPSGTTISNISANEDGRGVELDSSSYVTLDQLSFNKMTGNTLFFNGSSHVTLSNSKLKATADGQVPHNSDGLYAVNSAYLSIGGVPACPTNQICNSFDYDSGWAVYLQNTHDVTIDHASANADDTGGYVLDNAWNVDLGHSTAQAAGPICITVNGQKTHSGYYADIQGGLLLVNGSHDDAIHDDQFAGDKGYAIGSGGNGFFADPCTHSNQPFSPVEAPMGSGNTFTNVCYSSTDIASLEPVQPCN
jgi:DNA invertase Pin-like site-specific DNA recombinase